MADMDPPPVTTLLARIRSGDAAASNELVEHVYGELRRAAASLMRQERADHTLQPTALVHEAFACMAAQDALRQAPDRAYFFAAAARAMRQVLVDHARRRAALKRLNTGQRVPFEDVLDQCQRRRLDLVALHDSLEELATLNERQAKIVELRFFGGFEVAEVADMLGVSVSTVEGDFRKARAFMKARLVEPVE